MTLAISKIIHQTWRSSEVPERWMEFQRSWPHYQEAWDYRLWTDLALRQLIVEHYPWFLPIYDNYPKPIQRVDAARYFILHRYGGVYADLDFECLRPLEPLLRGRELVLGLEPEAHLSKNNVRAHGLDRLVCNAFMASQPRHPFWEHVFLELVGAHRRSGPLETTGPFLLTQAVQTFAGREPIEILPAEVLYPGTSDEAARGLLIDPAWRQKNAARAYAIHHWSGSWVGE
jgi:mannosyltransferase OCH1-like enzyme